MEHRPCEANSLSASQEIPRPLWNPKVHYCVHNSPPLVPFLSQMHPVHSVPPCFRTIRLDKVVPVLFLTEYHAMKAYWGVEVKRPECEANHSPPCSAEVKECVELYLHSPNTPLRCGVQLKKSSGTTSTFTVTFTERISMKFGVRRSALKFVSKIFILI
jgi:hypothetical protein